MPVGMGRGLGDEPATAGRQTADRLLGAGLGGGLSLDRMAILGVQADSSKPIEHLPSRARFPLVMCPSVRAAVCALALFVPQPAPADEIEEWPLPEVEEPSGVVYHPLRKTLFVAGDEGDIYELSLTGEVLASKNIGGDLEGVTCDPASGLLYVVREGHETVFEVRPGDLKILRRFAIDRTFEGNANFLNRGGDGVEGITFVPRPGHREGGSFYAVNQNDPPVLIELALPLHSSKERFERAVLLGARKVAASPLSGVLWDPPSGGFLVISALWRSVYVTDREGAYLASVKVPGLLPEGISRLPDGSFIIVQDTGGLIRWKPAKDPFILPPGGKGKGEGH